MSRSSRVLIQGTGVPGGFLEVVVPVDHTFATDFARATYDFPDAQYIWVRSWSNEDGENDCLRNQRRAAAKASSTPMSFGEKVVGAGLLLFLAMLVSIFGDDTPDDPTPEGPKSSYEAPAPAAPSAPAYVPAPSPVAPPRYVSEPPVTPVWEMDEDLTGNPDFTFND